MKILLFFLIVPATCFSQENGDHKIILTVEDTSNLYNRIKYAMVDNDFIVKDDGRKDSLSTYPVELGSLPGLSRLFAKINGHTIILSGIYGLQRIDDWGYNRNPKQFKPIVYYQGGKGKAWRLLLAVAEDIGWTSIAYSK